MAARVPVSRLVKRFSSMIRAGATRPLRVFALLAVLVLGVAVHEWHHAIEPHAVDAGPAASGHPCVCAPMHAGALVAESLQAPAPAPATRSAETTASLVAPVAAPRSLAAPRAPPAA